MATSFQSGLQWFYSKSPTCEPSSCKEANVKLTNEDLMELEVQRKVEERPEEGEVTKEPKKFMTQETARGFSLFEEVVSFWGTGFRHRTGHKVCSSCSECSPVLLCNLWWGKKKKKKRATIQTSLDYFFKRRDRIESSKKTQNLCHQHQAWVELQPAPSHHLSLLTLQLCHLPPPLSSSRQ